MDAWGEAEPQSFSGVAKVNTIFALRPGANNIFAYPPTKSAWRCISTFCSFSTIKCFNAKTEGLKVTTVERNNKRKVWDGTPAAGVQRGELQRCGKIFQLFT